MTRVLITDGHELAGLATARSAGRGGFDAVVSVPSNRHRGAVRSSRWVRDVIESPDPWEESTRYEEWLGTQAASGAFDAVFPVSEASIVAAERVACPGVTFVMPDAASRAISLSKHHATRVAMEIGLDVPPTAFWFQDGDFDDQAIEGWEYPFIVKSDNAHTSHGTYRRGRTWIIRSRSELELVRTGLTALQCRAIAQHMVPGRGVSTSLMADGGRVLLEFGHRRLHEVPWQGGVSSLRMAHDDPDVSRPARALIAHVEYSGLAMVEFRQSDDGTPYFLEVNGRPWGSLALALHAGVDFPLLAIERALGRPTRQLDTTPRPGTRPLVCMNLVPGELQHLRSIVRSPELSAADRRRLAIRQGVDVARHLLDPRTCHDHWWWSDPGPGLAQVSRLASGLRGRFGRAVRRTRRHLRRTDANTITPREVNPSARSVLWICSGNICRSPFADRLFTSRGTTVHSTSAGLHAVGEKSVPDWVRGFFDAHGVAWSGHRSRLLDADLAAESDLIVCMEEAHRRELVRRFPSVAGKTWLIGELGGLDDVELADPYSADVAVAAEIFSQLASAVEHVADLVAPAHIDARMAGSRA